MKQALFLLLLAAVPCLAAAQETTEWHDAASGSIDGKGWTDSSSLYDRLPARANGVVREPVWNLSRDSAGLSVRFETDARTIRIRYKLNSKELAMPHMPATGVSGVDLYVEAQPGCWHWLAANRPTSDSVESKLISGLAKGKKNFTLYLPLYNGIESLEIGVPAGASFRFSPPRKKKPILFYGTSIMQGGCASRPGMAFPSILGRRLDRPVINLGFSGNGKMEPEVADLLAELDPCVYVIDCLPNMNAAQVAERAKLLVQRLRKAHAKTPIVLVEDRTYSNAAFVSAKSDRHDKSRRALKDAFESLARDGVRNILYVEGDRLLGSDGEATVDNSHPTDLGMMRYADALEPVLREILGKRDG